MELVHFLSKMKDPQTGEVLIPGFYDEVDPIDPEQEKVNIALQARTNPLATAGTKTLIGKYDFYTQKGLRPTLEITGIASGYMGQGYRNAIPGSAAAKINFRLVSSQTPLHLTKILDQFLAANVPPYIDYNIAGGDFGPAVKVNTASPMIRNIMSIQEKVYGQAPVITACGAGIPIVSDFKEILGADSLLISLGNEDCNMHGVDENYTLDLAEKGLQFSEFFFSK
jgi:acetylornithine deacetylase/succinyl-diaminopimelate desuccinylase-like protein